MKFVAALSTEQQKALQNELKNNSDHRVRQRAQAILLSARGYAIEALADIFSVHRNTISEWLDLWQTHGVTVTTANELGSILKDAPRSGRPSSITAEQEQMLLAEIEANPRSIREALVRVKKKTSLKISRDVARRILTAAGYVWRRVRRTLRSLRDQQAFEAARAELLALHRQEAGGRLALYYLDEAGFSLQPVVPYGWQKSDTIASCTSGSHHRRLNVIGMMQCNGDFDSYTIEGSITSDVVIACIDAFITRLRSNGMHLPVVIVLDNASIHTSEIEEHHRRWLAQGVRLKYLPPYSPELNMIEILWRRMKYQWLPLDATEDWTSLVDAVEYILKNIGTEYQVTFS